MTGSLYIAESIGGVKCKMRFFGTHCLDSEGGVMPFNAQMAVVSHYFHNRGYATEDVFKEKAKGLLIDMGKSIFDETSETEGEDLVSESPTQLTLFSDFFDVPFPCCKHPRFTFIDLFPHWQSQNTDSHDGKGHRMELRATSFAQVHRCCVNHKTINNI